MLWKSVLFVFACALMAGCASFRPSSDKAGKEYSPEFSILLGGFSDLAYIKSEEELVRELSARFPGYSLLRKVSEKETGYDAQAFVAYDDKNVIISVRGSEFPFVSMDWRNNSKFFQYTNRDVSSYCPGAGMHGGFFQSALRIKAVGLQGEGPGSAYREIERLQKEGRNLYFTGHSLGGAIAQVLALFTSYETDLHVSGVYTYGEPKGGNSFYQDCHDKKLRDVTFRFINNRDVVARVRGPGNYVHVGNLAYFDRSGDLYSVNTYSTRLGVFGDILLMRVFTDHRIKSYNKLLRKNSTVNPFDELPNNSLNADGPEGPPL